MSATATTVKEAAQPDAAAPPKKSKKKLIIIVAVLVLLIGGYEAKSILLAPHYKPGQKVPLGKIVPLDQITVNTTDNHYVQLNISLQLTTVAVAGTISSDLPRFDDAVIAVIGSETQAKLLAPGGKDAAKAAMLQAFQKIAGTVDGAAQQITAVYYTNIVIQ